MLKSGDRESTVCTRCASECCRPRREQSLPSATDWPVMSSTWYAFLFSLSHKTHSVLISSTDPAHAESSADVCSSGAGGAGARRCNRCPAHRAATHSHQSRARSSCHLFRCTLRPHLVHSFCACGRRTMSVAHTRSHALSSQPLPPLLLLLLLTVSLLHRSPHQR
jgi:hypothetical protein